MKSNDFIKKYPGLIKEAQKCKSLEDFLSLAQKNKIKFEDISLEDAFYFLTKNQSLSDELLDNVAGGSKNKGKKVKLVRVDNPYEAAAFRQTGNRVLSQYGDNFVVK